MSRSFEAIEISEQCRLATEPLVSVYMLVYNHAPYVATAIEGVISQQCAFPFELIIGEDCSTDASASIVRAYQERYPSIIRIVTSEANVGPIANAERCFKAAKGEFIAFCEGDDYWHAPRKLQSQVDALQANPGATLVHTEYNRRTGDRVLVDAHARNRTPHLAQGDHAFLELLHGMTVITATAMYRKRILDDLASSGLAKKEWPFGDYPKALFASMRGQVLFLPVSTATYREVQGSATRQGRAKFLRMHEASLECSEVFMREAGLPAEQANAVRRYRRNSLLMLSLLSGDRDAYATHDAWLARNGSRAPAPLRAIHRILLSLPVLLRGYRGLLLATARLRVLLRYRPAAPDPVKWKDA